MINNDPASIDRWITPCILRKMMDGPALIFEAGACPLIIPSYGMAETGYDIRLRDTVKVEPGHSVLGVALEHIKMPPSHCAHVVGKSTLARLGIHLNTTAVDPDWEGSLTLEISYLPKVGAPRLLYIPAGAGIGTIQFHELMVASHYSGKYQGTTEAEDAR